MGHIEKEIREGHIQADTLAFIKKYMYRNDILWLQEQYDELKKV